MSSLVIHLYIGKKIMEKYNYSNSFLLGEIMPDIIKITGIKKEITHYMKNDREYDLSLYINNNLKENITDENLGYFAHLLQDKLFDKYLETRAVPVYKNNKKYAKYLYNDMIVEEQDFMDRLYDEYAIFDNILISEHGFDFNKIKDIILKENKYNEYTNVIKEQLIKHPVIKYNNMELLQKDKLFEYINNCVLEYDKYVNNIK